MGALIAQLEAETAIKPVRRGDYNIRWEADSLFHTELEWFALGDILGTRSERRIASRRGSPHRCWCKDALLIDVPFPQLRLLNRGRPCRDKYRGKELVFAARQLFTDDLVLVPARPSLLDIHVHLREPLLPDPLR